VAFQTVLQCHFGVTQPGGLASCEQELRPDALSILAADMPRNAGVHLSIFLLLVEPAASAVIASGLLCHALTKIQTRSHTDSAHPLPTGH
jgi:hypothetical protein